mmetsp:Transcript_30188/g.72462  ORF Transcript_30188/g.72462 Transcript_30188/m.72462 type:complete len:177 (-) Transcript_30188:705-1235(-)
MKHAVKFHKNGKDEGPQLLLLQDQQQAASTRQGFDRVWKMITPLSGFEDDTTPRESSKRVKAPTAPKKAIQFLSRTSLEFDEDEIQPLTPNRASLGSTLSRNSIVQPTRLRLSPYHSASSNDSNNARQRKRGRRPPRTRLSLDDAESSDRQRRQRHQDLPISPPKNNRFTNGRRYS